MLSFAPSAFLLLLHPAAGHLDCLLPTCGGLEFPEQCSCPQAACSRRNEGSGTGKNVPQRASFQRVIIFSVVAALMREATG